MRRRTWTSLVGLVAGACFLVTPAALAASCAGLELQLESGEAPPRLFAAEVVDTAGGSALVEVRGVWAGPDLAPEVWVAGLGGATPGSRWLVGSALGEVRTDGCLSADLERTLVHRTAFDVRPPSPDGDPGQVPLTARFMQARPLALGLLVVMVVVAVGPLVSRGRAGP